MIFRNFTRFSNDTFYNSHDIFTPKFDSNGLIVAVVTENYSNILLMVAYMDKKALELTFKTSIVHFWSRSRNKIWKKGETSGNFLNIKEIYTDCDQDAIWIKVKIDGNEVACHTGSKSCFYKSISF